MRGAGWFHHGWRQGLAVAGLCALVGAAGSTMLLRSERDRLVDDAGTRLSAYAQTMAQRLDTGLANWANDVGLLARFEAFERQPAEPAMQRRLLEDLRTRSPTFSWIGFTGADGRVIAATGGLLEGVDVSARPWFRPGLAGLHLGDVHSAVLLAKLLPVEQGGGEDAYFVDAAAPVHAADGKLLGVISGHLTWRWAESVRKEMVELAPWQPAPELLVLGADGQVLLGPDDERGRPWPGAVPSGARAWQNTTPAGRPESVLAYARAEVRPGEPNLGWVVVARRDRAEVLAALWPFGIWLGLGTLGIALLGGLIAGWNAARTGSALHRVLGDSRGRNVAARLEQLRDQAWRDPLTGLLNRAGFEAWRQAQPALAQGCVVVALDLDGFKPINDRYGHAAGDAVLRGIGEWLLHNLRGNDAAVRLGGDEFLLCLPGPAEKVEDAAREVAARLNAALQAGLETPEGRLSLGTSMGFAFMPRDSEDMQAAIAQADAALYAAKRLKPRSREQAVATAG